MADELPNVEQKVLEQDLMRLVREVQTHKEMPENSELDDQALVRLAPGYTRRRERPARECRWCWIEKTRVPGLIFVARVRNPDAVEKSFSPQKHSEGRWFDPKDLDGIDSNDFVPEFALSVRRAVAVNQAPPA